MRYYSPETASVKQVKSPNRFLYAISDIHGCDIELKELISQLDISPTEDLVIFCGDYIDRGRSSKNVLQYLVDFKKKYPNTEFIRGNHDSMLLSYMGIQGNYYGSSHLDPCNGGASFWESYNLSLDYVFSEKVEGSAKNLIPRKHLELLVNTEYIIETDKFIFVHAGLDPTIYKRINGKGEYVDRPITEQIEEECLWIRDKWIQAEHNYGKIVVYGHTRNEEGISFDLPYKICIDCGCAYGGKLACIELNNMKEYYVEAKE